MRLLALLFVLPVCLPLTATARPGWTTGTFVYANLCTEPDGGLAGRRVVVRRSPNGNDVTYEAAAGTRASALPVEALAIDDGRQEIAFTVDNGGRAVHFRGTVASTLLAGTISDEDGEHPLRLRRVLRSHEHEDCRSVQTDPDTTASTN